MSKHRYAFSARILATEENSISNKLLYAQAIITTPLCYGYRISE
jgi:hypothetical protein